MSHLTNHDAERALLAVIAQNPTDVDHILDDLDRSLFSNEENRVLYLALVKMTAAGEPIDLNLLLQRLEASNDLQNAGGRSAVTALWYHDTAVLTNAPAYLTALREASTRRRLANVLSDLTQLVETHDGTASDVLEVVDTELMAITRAALGQAQYITATGMVSGALDLIARARERGDGLLGLDTGFKALNDMIGGWEPGTFTILQGTPGAGKTAFWLQSALHVATQEPVALVQLEMTEAKMGLRALANEGRVDLGRMRRANLSDRDYHRLSEAMGRIGTREVYIAPPHVQTIERIRTWFKRMHRELGCTSLWIDNIKIVETDKPMRDIERFQYVTRSLKLLAREMDIPVIAIHHLHRLAEGEKPSLTSGYGSSSVEQDVDALFSLWQPDPDARYLVQLLAHKTRDDAGAGTSVDFEWRGNHQRFVENTPDENAQEQARMLGETA